MVLYHAISSYQILCVILHKMNFHRKEKSILILPDFIVQKYPQYSELVELKLFDEVYLFPYLYIPHDEKTILSNTSTSYIKTVPYNIHEFDRIYVAGAHFYFSLYLISKDISFAVFEDAAGMLSRSDELYFNLKRNFPIHAKIAKANGLFDGSNRNIKTVYYLKNAQTIDPIHPKYEDFNVMTLLKKVGILKRKRIIKFFVSRKYVAVKDSVILLTQHFANLGEMTENEQVAQYVNLRDKYLLNRPIIIKAHPDDTIDYRNIFPDAIIINEKFPSELLPFVFYKKPKSVISISSTGKYHLKDYFKIIVMEKV